MLEMLIFQVNRMPRLVTNFRTAVWLALEHDVLNTAKAVAYSGMLMIFPTVLVLTTLIALVPEGPTLVGEVRSASEQFLPADTMSLMQSAIISHRIQSNQLIFSAASLSVFAGLGLMLSLIEGFRRAYRLPRDQWGFWEKRIRALLLELIVLVPLALATMLLVFGHAIEQWMIDNADHQMRHVVLFLWRLARWSLAGATSVTVLGVLYHFGTERGEHWMRIIPGAIVATLVWFPATLAFGWYVTRLADYSKFYGSFGAGIATLVWLYISSFSALLGAELNGVLFRERHNQF